MKTKLLKTLSVLTALLFVFQATACMCVPAAVGSAVATAELLSHKDDISDVLVIESGNDVALPMPSGMTEDVEEGEVSFSDIVYERPDTSEISDAIAQLSEKVSSGDCEAEAVLDEYEEILEMYNHLDSEESLAYVLYAIDVTDEYYSDEYDFLVEELNRIDLELTDLSILMYETDGIAQPMIDRFGEQYRENVYAGEKMNSPEIQDDLSAEQKLVSEYDSLLTTFVVEDGGRIYTMEEISAVADTDYTEYVRLFELYYSQLNQKAGELYLKLLKIRNRISETLHYDNYAEYMYEAYGRDYTTEEITEIHQAVKEYVVPLYTEAVIRQYLMTRNADPKLSKISMPTFLNRFDAVLGDFSEKIQNSFHYMIRNGMFTADVSEKKMETSFTTYLWDYQSPFIFTQYEGEIRNAKTLIHESGHFANFYYSQAYGWSISDPLDIAEIDSQGLELLMMHYYEQLFGNMASTERKEQLIDGLYSVISGCMEDELQQIVYKNPDMTLEEINSLYYDLAGQYGLADLYGYTGTEWVAIPHSFQSPMYYISYATSMIAALEIWENSEKDYVAAREQYLKILCRPANSKLRTLAQETGLKDPISSETVISLASAVRKALNLD